jgi:hypothetical protein
VEFEAARERQRLQVRRDLSLAWHIEAMQRQKKLPSLITLLSEREPGQTVGQQKAMLTMLSEQYGFPLRTRKRKKK